MKEMIERFEKKVAHLIAELKAELGLTGAHTDSGGNGPPPHKPPVLDPEG